VSECVGLDVEDLDFKNDAVKVTRKGGNEMFVYFGEEVEKALLDYLEVRETVTPVTGHEHALFYSIQRKRMGVQAVENLGKKIRTAYYIYQENHPSQTAKHLRYRPIPGNWRYLSGCRCIRP